MSANLVIQTPLILKNILKYFTLDDLKTIRQVNTTFASEATRALRSKLVYFHLNPIKPLNFCPGDTYYKDIFLFITTHKLSSILSLSFLKYPMIHNHENNNSYFLSLPPEHPYVIKYKETIDIDADPRQRNDTQFYNSLTSDAYFSKIIPFIKELRLEYNFLEIEDLISFANFLHLLSPHLKKLCLDVASWFKEDAILPPELDTKLNKSCNLQIHTFGFRVLCMNDHYNISLSSCKILLELLPALKFLDLGGFEQHYEVFEPYNKIPVCFKALLELGESYFEKIEGLKILGTGLCRHDMDLRRDLVPFTEKVKLKELHIHIYNEVGLSESLQNLASSLETLTRTRVFVSSLEILSNEQTNIVLKYK